MGKSLILGGLARTAELIACTKEAVFQALEQQKGQNDTTLSENVLEKGRTRERSRYQNGEHLGG
jgi:hypothetical protein